MTTRDIVPRGEKKNQPDFARISQTVLWFPRDRLLRFASSGMIRRSGYFGLVLVRPKSVFNRAHERNVGAGLLRRSLQLPGLGPDPVRRK